MTQIQNIKQVTHLKLIAMFIDGYADTFTYNEKHTRDYYEWLKKLSKEERKILIPFGYNEVKNNVWAEILHS